MNRQTRGWQRSVEEKTLSKKWQQLRPVVWGSLAGLLLGISGWAAARVAAQTGSSGTITLRADVQEANSLTGVITARGNVQVEYPARDIYATSAQAQFFSEERRIILSGDVVVLQEGNRLEAETVTYLIDEGQFVALPQPNRQVQTTYSLPASSSSPDGSTPGTSATGPGAGSAAVGTEDALSAPFEPDATLNISPLESSDDN